MGMMRLQMPNLDSSIFSLFLIFFISNGNAGDINNIAIVNDGSGSGLYLATCGVPAVGTVVESAHKNLMIKIFDFKSITFQISPPLAHVVMRT